MQQDTKWVVGSGVLTVVFVILNAMLSGMRVLTLLMLFIFLIALTFRAARPRSED